MTAAAEEDPGAAGEIELGLDEEFPEEEFREFEAPGAAVEPGAAVVVPLPWNLGMFGTTNDLTLGLVAAPLLLEPPLLLALPLAFALVFGALGPFAFVIAEGFGATGLPLAAEEVDEAGLLAAGFVLFVLVFAVEEGRAADFTFEFCCFD